MNDLPAEWIEPAEDELGPHGTPVPPPTWTPEREAEVARWRDELMAAGEARDLERERRYARKIVEARKMKRPYGAIATWLGLTKEEVHEIEEQASWRASILSASATTPNTNATTSLVVHSQPAE